MYEKLRVQIIDDLETNDIISLKNKKYLQRYKIDINKIPSRYGTNLIGECLSPRGVKSLMECGIRCEDETGRIGIWCEESILHFLIQLDMNFRPCLEFISKRINECELSIRPRLMKRKEDIIRLLSTRKKEKQNKLFRWTYKDIVTVISLYI
jgi:hypothetical protein